MDVGLYIDRAKINNSHLKNLKSCMVNKDMTMVGTACLSADLQYGCYLGCEWWHEI